MTLIDPDQLGYLDREVPNGAIVVNDERLEEPVQINPEWLRTVPAGQREPAVLAVLPEPAGPPPIGDTEHPEGERLKLSQVGELYRDWYAREHSDVDACKAQAEAHNAAVAEHNARIMAKRKTREAKGEIIPRNSRSFRLIPKQMWLHCAPRKVRQHHREHERYYAEFVTFMGDKTIDLVTGEDFRNFYDHCHKTAKLKAKPTAKRPLTNPARWVNHRLQAVAGAFRRVKKRYPNAAWARGLFGEDGLLAILEQRNTGREGKKVRITPAEFKALLEVADAQWKALLMLSLNAALKNSDMLIPWTAIDFEQGLMDYPRPKNGRKRVTPLAPETLAALAAWRNESKSRRPEVFVTKDGTPWISTTDSIAKHWDVLRERVKDKTGHRIPATFDSLRKTPRTEILEAGVPNAKEAIQFLLGHMPHEAWRYYVGVAPACLFPAVEVVRGRFLAQL